MAEPNINARLQDIESYRQQILSQPHAQGISSQEVREHLASLPLSRFPQTVYNNRGSTPLIQPRGGFSTFEAQLKLTQKLYAAGADFIPLTVDSCTRQNQYNTAANLLQRSEEEGKDYLNGYPLITHGYEITRELYREIDRPISLRHGTPDARLLVEVAIASGITEIEGGGICYCLPYSEGFPLDRSLLYWQYIDRICAENSTKDAPIHRESFGPLSATLVPPAIAVTIQIIEALLAAEQGVTSFAVSFGQTGSIIQDLATAKILRKLTRTYLDRFGFETVQIYLVYHQWMGQFPPQREKAAALIVSSSIISSLISADKIVVKTVNEALGVPAAEDNAEATNIVKYTLERFRYGDILTDSLTSPLVEQEAALIESETKTILQTIFDLSGDVFWESVFRAFQLGYLDVPFSPHNDNANKLISMRDANCSIRILEKGNVPISDQDTEIEKSLLASKYNKSDKTYQQLLADINIMV